MQYVFIYIRKKPFLHFDFEQSVIACNASRVNVELFCEVMLRVVYIISNKKRLHNSLCSFSPSTILVCSLSAVSVFQRTKCSVAYFLRKACLVQ